MFKKTVIAMLLVSLPTFSNAQIICPSTVKAGKALRVTAIIKNDDCYNDLTINKTIVSLLGNSGSAAISTAVGGVLGPATGTLGLIGPFVTPLANNFSTLIPHATCNYVPYYPDHPEWGGDTQIIPTTQTLSSLLVVNPVPVGLGGTLVAVTAGVLDINNEIKMAGVCHITVLK